MFLGIEGEEMGEDYAQTSPIEVDGFDTMELSTESCSSSELFITF